MTQSRTPPAGDVFRVRLTLMLADGEPYRTIQERLETTAPTIFRWRDRFEKRLGGRPAGRRHPGRKLGDYTRSAGEGVEASRRKPNDGSTHR
jgi:transposase-like protein